MSSFGVTDQGFVQKELDDVKTDIEDQLTAAFGAGINLLATSVFGQLTGVFSGQSAEIWEIAQEIYASAYPDSASGTALDNVASITGATRLAAQTSTTTLTLNLNAGVVLNEGRIVSIGSDGSRYITTDSVTNPRTYQWTVEVDAESQEYGPIPGNAGTIDTIQTPVSGWLQSIGENSGNAEPYNLTDGWTLTIKVDGGAVQTATFNTGDFAAIGAATAAEVAAVIATDITGVTAIDAGGYVRVTNSNTDAGNSLEFTGGTANGALGFDTSQVLQGFNRSDVIVGRDIETDEDFRIRRVELLRTQGGSAVEAIRAALRSIDGVNQAFVFENVTDVTDGDGLPPHSFESVVRAPTVDDQTIAAEIWTQKGAGIQTHGTTTEVVTDSQDIDHDIKFTRATELDMYVDVTITRDPDVFGGGGVGGDAAGILQVKDAIVAESSDQGIGDDVIILQYRAAPLDVAGVIDVTVTKIDTVDPPINTSNISIDNRELAVFDTSRIDVTIA